MLNIQLFNHQLTFSVMARPLFFAAALFYLGYHTFHGDRGVYALFVEQRKLLYLEQEVTRLSAEEARMKTRVAQFSNGVLDKDLLDEQARTMLGLMGKNEVMVILE